MTLSVSTSAWKPAVTDYFRQYVVVEKSQSGTDVSVTWERETLTGSLLLLAVIGERISDAHATATVPAAFTSFTSTAGTAGNTCPYFQIWKIENSAARSGTETVTMSGSGYAAQAILMEVDGGNAVTASNQGIGTPASTSVTRPSVVQQAQQEVQLVFTAFDYDITSGSTTETPNDYWMHGGLYRHSGAYLGHIFWYKEASKQASGRRIVGKELSAEDYGIFRVADIGIGMGQNKDDASKHEVVFYLTKSRDSEKDKAERYFIDFKTMSFRYLRQEDLSHK